MKSRKLIGLILVGSIITSQANAMPNPIQWCQNAWTSAKNKACQAGKKLQDFYTNNKKTAIATAIAGTAALSGAGVGLYKLLKKPVIVQPKKSIFTLTNGLIGIGAAAIITLGIYELYKRVTGQNPAKPSESGALKTYSGLFGNDNPEETLREQLEAKTEELELCKRYEAHDSPEQAAKRQELEEEIAGITEQLAQLQKQQELEVEDNKTKSSEKSLMEKIKSFIGKTTEWAKQKLRLSSANSETADEEETLGQTLDDQEPNNLPAQGLESQDFDPPVDFDGDNPEEVLKRQLKAKMESQDFTLEKITLHLAPQDSDNNDDQQEEVPRQASSLEDKQDDHEGEKEDEAKDKKEKTGWLSRLTSTLFAADDIEAEADEMPALGY